jgi:hypothetical protein
MGRRTRRWSPAPPPLVISEIRVRLSMLPTRAVLGALLSVALIGAAVASFAADPTAGCSFTDPAGDSAVGPAAGDDDLDIVRVGFSSDATTFYASVQLKKLKVTGPDNYPGDDFELDFTYNKKSIQMGATRVPNPDGSGNLKSSNYAIVDGTNSASSAPSLKATYNLTTSVFTTQVSLADLAKLGGAPSAGAVLTGLGATAYAYLGTPEETADTATSPKGAAFAIGGSSCDGTASGGPAPAPSASATSPAAATASPTASASGSAAPSGTPNPSVSAGPGGGGAADGPVPGCVDITDPKGDAQPNATNPGAPTPNDPDLDILAVNFQTEPQTIKGYLKIDKLGTAPQVGNGHRFDVMFNVGAKSVEVYAGQPDAVAANANAALVAAGQSAPAAGGVRIAGTYNASIKTSAVFDVKNSRVVLSVDRPTLEKALAATVPDGTVVKATAGHSRNFTPTAGSVLADTAQAAKAEEQVYTVGDNRCFQASSTPPAAASGGATITFTAPSRVQSSDTEAVTATLKDDKGAPMAGKRVTAQVGSGPVAAGTTNTSGQVRLAARVSDPAGSRLLLIRYPGDPSGAGAAQARTSINVVAEVSKIAYRSTGAGTTRTFTITLTDDDAPTKHPYAGSTVTFGFSGKTVKATTDRLGRASVQAKPGAHIDVRYAGRSGYVRAGTARTVVA